MTPIHDVYLLQSEDLIDPKRIDEIKAKSYSRIPVLDGFTHVSVGILFMNDLVDIDFDERSYFVHELPLRPLKIVGSRTALDTMFRKFISARSHLMAVEKCDEIVGVITIEDLLEELVGQEIEDESDQSRHEQIASL